MFANHVHSHLQVKRARVAHTQVDFVEGDSESAPETATSGPAASRGRRPSAWRQRRRRERPDEQMQKQARVHFVLFLLPKTPSQMPQCQIQPRMIAYSCILPRYVPWHNSEEGLVHCLSKAIVIALSHRGVSTASKLSAFSRPIYILHAACRSEITCG